MRTVHAREAQQQLSERFGDKVFGSVVRRSVRYAESAERGVSILDFKPELGADYVDLAGELLERLGMDEERERVLPCARSSCRLDARRWRDSALEQARLVREGEVSARELVEAALRRAEELQERLNCFVSIDAERALAAADDGVRGRPAAVRRRADGGQGHHRLAPTTR